MLQVGEELQEKRQQEATVTTEEKRREDKDNTCRSRNSCDASLTTVFEWRWLSGHSRGLRQVMRNLKAGKTEGCRILNHPAALSHRFLRMTCRKDRAGKVLAFYYL